MYNFVEWFTYSGKDRVFWDRFCRKISLEYLGLKWFSSIYFMNKSLNNCTTCRPTFLHTILLNTIFKILQLKLWNKIISFGFMLSMKISVMFYFLQKNSALAVGLGTAQQMKMLKKIWVRECSQQSEAGQTMCQALGQTQAMIKTIDYILQRMRRARPSTTSRPLAPQPCRRRGCL